MARRTRRPGLSSWVRSPPCPPNMSCRRRSRRRQGRTPAPCRRPRRRRGCPARCCSCSLRSPGRSRTASRSPGGRTAPRRSRWRRSARWSPCSPRTRCWSGSPRSAGRRRGAEDGMRRSASTLHRPPPATVTLNSTVRVEKPTTGRTHSRVPPARAAPATPSTGPRAARPTGSRTSNRVRRRGDRRVVTGTPLAGSYGGGGAPARRRRLPARAAAARVAAASPARSSG